MCNELLVGEKLSQFALEERNAKQTSHARDELKFVHRLAEKVIGAALNGAFVVANFMQRGHHDDDDVARRWITLDLAADFEPRHLGHHHIE